MYLHDCISGYLNEHASSTLYFSNTVVYLENNINSVTVAI